MVKMKTGIKILIGILVGIIILAGFLVSRPKEKIEKEGMHVLPAIPVFYSNSGITSEQQASTLFNQNFDEIINDTKAAEIPGPFEPRKTIEEAILFPKFISIEKRGWSNDAYWLPYGYGSAYVVVIPMVSKDDIWIEKDGKIFVERIKVKGLQPAESVAFPIEIKTYEEAKKYLFENYPGATSTSYIETKSYIKYLIDENGTVYWAGMYLDKSWVIS
jgi:hypothetical protein